ncbi:MAG: N-acetylglucosamine-6-phosphate deacetylase [Selenomonadaceae bacterium]|nr:N-acetylglucosamine-6-phosphate deacetylase [Selenomonadaceae bacterium]
MKTITNGKIILPDERGNFFIATEKFLTFDEKIISFENSAEEIIDAQGNFVSPGFINIHIHGCANSDTMDATPAALKNMCEFLPTCGVTSFLPTTMTMPLAEIYAALKNIRNCKNVDGAKILGANVEGPFISAKYHGAQNPKNILRADLKLFEEFLDVIKIITVAPEELEDFNFIDACLEKNIIVSIGHSAATYEIAMAAIERGAAHITHLFNAQSGFNHRKPGIVGAAFDSNATVELIADNVHVCAAAQRIVQKIKPLDEIILITDSLRACGLGDCESELGGQKVFIKNGVAKLADGTIAASVAPMNDVVKKFYRNTKISIPEVVELVTKNPARKLNLYNEIGSLEIGKAADIVIFDEDFNIKSAFVAGKNFSCKILKISLY